MILPLQTEEQVTLQSEVLFDSIDVNTAYGADLVTLSAADALIVINACAEVLNLYRICRTSLLTLHTADTAVSTVLTGLRALLAVGTFNDHARNVINQMNKGIGAVTSADAATNAKGGLDLSYTVFNSNGALRTNCRTVTVSKAGGKAILVALIGKVCCDTVGLTAVVVRRAQLLELLLQQFLQLLSFL